jgi:TolA-binding protein
MKKTLALFVLALALSGCASMYGTVGIASTEYVDAKYAELEARTLAAVEQVDAVDAELAAIMADMQEIRTVTEQLRSAAQTISETRAAMDELQRLADVVEQRMATLGDETLAKLRDVLNGYLEGN